MTGRVLSIAANTFRETIRNKILYVILAFAILLILLTWFLANLSFGEFSRIIVNFGLGFLHVFGVIMAVFLGITLVSNEVERKTIYLILSKPVPRWEFVVGKTAGLVATLFLVCLAMTLVLFGVHLAYGGTAEPGILIAAAGIYMELVLLTCVAALFSSVTTPVLSAVFTLSTFLIGHVSATMVAVAARAKGMAGRLGAEFLYYALPNLELFNWKYGVAYGEVRSVKVLGPAFLYLLSYGAGVLVLACLLFTRKEFK